MGPSPHTSSPRRRRVAALGLVVAALATSLALAAPAEAAAWPALRTDYGALDLSGTSLGTTSPARIVTVHNEGPGTATGLAVDGLSGTPFARSGGTCGPSLAARTSCTVGFTYAPTAAVTSSANAVVRSAGGGAARIRLMGSPDAPAFPVRVTAQALDFGPTVVGSSSATQVVTLTNTSTTSQQWTVFGSAGAGPFTLVSSTCGTTSISATPGGGCALTYRFSPTATGPVERTLPLQVQVTTAPSLRRSFPLQLRGRGGFGDVHPLVVTGTVLDFGRVDLGATTATQATTIRNASSSAVTFSMAGGAAYAPFANGNDRTCGGTKTLAPGGSCAFTYQATPTTPGLTLQDSGFTLLVAGFPDRAIPIRLSVHGVGSAPRSAVSSSEVILGPSAVGVPTAAIPVTLSNTGTAPMTNLFIAAPEPNPRIEISTTTCGATIAAGASCTLSLRYTPTDGTNQFKRYRITSSAAPVQIDVFAGPTSSVNGAFVRQASLDFLGAEPTPAVLAQAAELDAGRRTRRQVLTQLGNSPERVTSVVQRLYRQTLGRPGDLGGVSFWVNRIRSGRRTVAQVAAELYASPEYYAGLGGGTDTTWVTDLFVKLLGRAPDSGGLRYWVGQTAARGRVDVAGRFYQSEESRRTRVKRIYQELLDRDPDAGGRDYWARRILAEGDLALAIELASSTEYLRRAQLARNYGPS